MKFASLTCYVPPTFTYVGMMTKYVKYPIHRVVIYGLAQVQLAGSSTSTV